MVPPDRLERSRPKPAVFETAASTCSAKRALVRAEGLEPPRCYPSHSECGASAYSATRAWCSLVASIHPPPRYQPGALPNELRERYLIGAGRGDRVLALSLTKRVLYAELCRRIGAGSRSRTRRLPRTKRALCRHELSQPDKTSAETSTLERERPTGRRGALCTRAPSWTFTSFDPCGSQFMPASKRTADGPALAACRNAATNAVTLRSRFDLLVYE